MGAPLDIVVRDVQLCEAAMFGQGRDIAGTVYYADDYDCVRRGKIIDGVGAVEGDPQAWRELAAGGIGEREMA